MVTYLREEDHWLYFIGFLTVLAGAAALYASVMTFRGPAILAALLGLWFSYREVNKGYGLNKARIHLGALVLFSSLLAFGIYVLTN